VLNIKQTLIVVGISVAGLSGCGQEKQSINFSSDDYAVLAQITEKPTDEFDLYSHIDSVLGLKKLSYLHFLNEVTPYTQITLECIHSGALKLDSDKSASHKVVKNDGLNICIKNASQKPVMVDVLLTHSNGWNIERMNYVPEVKQLINEAKKDNVLTVDEFLKIGSLVELEALKVDDMPLKNKESNTELLDNIEAVKTAS